MFTGRNSSNLPSIADILVNALSKTHNCVNILLVGTREHQDTEKRIKQGQENTKTRKTRLRWQDTPENNWKIPKKFKLKNNAKFE
jgi:hypothetical protein